MPGVSQGGDRYRYKRRVTLKNWYNDKMKKVFFGLTLFLFLPSISVAMPAVSSEDAAITYAGPAIILDHPVHYFGMVYANKKLSHTFNFRNDGTDVLVIEKLSAP
jgi:hypothetical protein